VFEPGARLGDYTLERFIARGGNSDVWLANAGDRTVVVRVPRLPGRPLGKLPGGSDAEFTTLVGMWQRDIHPGLTRVLSTHVDDGVRYVVAQHAEGIDLHDLFERARDLDRWPSAEMCSAIVARTAEALHALHQQVWPDGRAVVHRSLSPDKIVITRLGAIRVLDPAWIPTRQEDVDTVAIQATDKTPYMSPALASNPGCDDPTADLFSVGVILWELLSHRPLFRRDSDLDTIAAIQEGVVPNLPSSVPVHLGIVASKCLAKDPADRYTTGAELAEAIDLALGDHPDADPNRIAALVPRDSPTAMEKSAPVDPTAQSPIQPFGDEFFDPTRDAPTTVGNRFRLLDRLGAGGMGEVYLAYDLELEERIALKVISPDLAGDAAQIERMRREVRLARKIKSDRVCRIHDILELPDGGRGVSMELIDGKPLGTRMKEGVLLDYKLFARWGADIAEGLAAAHAHNIVHRDLKPDNVMITGGDRAVILDFGVARSREQSKISGAKLTGENIILGTIPYMAPEQLTNGRLDGRTDLYALGLILAELITGETPFGSNAYGEALNMRVINPTRYRIHELDENVPADIANIIDQLLRTNPDDRPRHASEVANALRVVGHEGPLPSAPPSLTPSLTPARGGTMQMEPDPFEDDAGPPDTEATPAPSQAQIIADPSPRRAFVAVAAIGTFILGAALTFTVVRHGLGSSDQPKKANGSKAMATVDAGAPDATPVAAEAAAAAVPAPTADTPAKPKRQPLPRHPPPPRRPRKPAPLPPAEEM